MIKDIKEGISASLKAFANGNLSTNALNLFTALGYVTDRQAPLHKPRYEEFKETYISGRKFDEKKAKTSEWNHVDLLFQLSKEEILQQISLFDTRRVDSTIIETYLFFTIGLKNEQYSRTDLSLITREVNRLFPMPVMILFRHGNSLTLSVIDRRVDKRDESKDVLEKVTLIKDISISSPHRAHIEILFDLSLNELKEQYTISNFVELHNAWQKTLDTKELNKRFFNELANWYFWASSKVVFPDDEIKDKDIRNATGVIRLITRLMFVWFLKEKNLVPDELFDEKKLKQLLKFSDSNKSSYYKAILQNLFFATLNTEMGSRKFRTAADKVQSNHYFIHNLFRYESEFVKPKETLEKYFAPIPFLNGGLFECLDKQVEANGKLKPVRIDGFSDEHDNTLKIPDELFFCEKEKTIDLSKVYGTPKKDSEKVRGLIDILSSYKFTVTENTPIEEEVALDPELLGKVFENLLANYNPETQTTARKQTGSFYTPREIVNYMVDESLLAYLKQQVNNEAGEEKLRDLLSYSQNPNPFNKAQTEKLIEAIDNIKIIDPACGSGAFPMGILQKLVHVLHKLDARNELWKQRQVEKAGAIDDTASRNAAIDTIEEAFENNELDYGRKLYLIENCIYGVDIQPIAVQIAKLRFFISLIVEQKTNPQKENLGVRPLPNLETKFVAANTLMELEQEQVTLFTNPEIDNKKQQLKKIRHDYFEARTPKRKENCRTKDKQLRDELANLLVTNHDLQPAMAKKIVAWNPYDQNNFAGFFDTEWMFGLKEGFDVVIGNPPWVSLIGKHGIEENTRNIEAYNRIYNGNTTMPNLYEYFILRGLHILKNKGHLTLIVPDRLGNNSSMSYLRKKLLDENNLLEIIYRWKFESVIADTMTFVVCKHKQKKYDIRVKYKAEMDWLVIDADSYRADKEFIFKSYKTTGTQKLVQQIKEKGKPLIQFCKTTSGFGGKSELLTDKRANKRQIEVIKGNCISNYSIDKKLYFEFIPENITGRTKDETKLSKKPKVLLRKTGNTLIAAYDNSGMYPEQSLYFLYDFENPALPKYFLLLLNSSLITWYYMNELVTNVDSTPQLKNYDLDALPVIIDKEHLKSFGFVAGALMLSKNSKPAIFTFFRELADAMVYEMYLPSAIKAAKAEVLKHIKDLPELKEGNEDKNLKTVEKIYKELSVAKHPIVTAMDKMESIEEILMMIKK